MVRTQAYACTNGSTIDPNPENNVVGTSHKAAGKRKKNGDEGGDTSLTNAEIIKYHSNLNDQEIWTTNFYHNDSMIKLGINDVLAHLFQRME